eukprot:4888349-Amphidinium_carterae.1
MPFSLRTCPSEVPTKLYLCPLGGCPADLASGATLLATLYSPSDFSYGYSSAPPSFEMFLGADGSNKTPLEDSAKQQALQIVHFEISELRLESC